MTKNWSFAKMTDIFLKKMRSVIVSQIHYLNKIIDVHPLSDVLINTSEMAMRPQYNKSMTGFQCPTLKKSNSGPRIPHKVVIILYQVLGKQRRILAKSVVEQGGMKSCLFPHPRKAFLEN